MKDDLLMKALAEELLRQGYEASPLRGVLATLQGPREVKVEFARKVQEVEGERVEAVAYHHPVRRRVVIVLEGLERVPSPDDLKRFF